MSPIAGRANAWASAEGIHAEARVVGQHPGSELASEAEGLDARVLGKRGPRLFGGYGLGVCVERPPLDGQVPQDRFDLAQLASVVAANDNDGADTVSYGDEWMNG